MNSDSLNDLRLDGAYLLRFGRNWSGWSTVVPSVLIGLGSLVAAGEAAAQIKFQHHYISTTFPRLSGFGQSTVGDFNNDGKLDFLIGQHFGTNEKRQYLFLNNGTPENWPFHLVTTDNTGDGGTNALDIDGDGWLDIVSSGSWFRNNRDPAGGTFTKFIFDEGAYGGHDMLIADINGDGKKDVVVNTDRGARAPGGENGLFWYDIPADPTQKWTRTRIGEQVHSGMWPSGIGDIDGDGDLDVFTHAWFENRDRGATWIRHDNVGFGRRAGFGFSQQSALVDMDRDGDLDIVHAESDYFNDAKVQWSENLDGKGGAWAAHPLSMNGETAGDFHSLAAQDFDRDGDIDVFAAESEWRATRARWFIWENIDGKGQTFERRTILEGLGAHNAIVGDMDGDGDIDIVNKEFAPASWNRLGGGQHADFLENQSLPAR